MAGMRLGDATVRSGRHSCRRSRPIVSNTKDRLDVLVLEMQRTSPARQAYYIALRHRGWRNDVQLLRLRSSILKRRLLDRQRRLRCT